MIPNLEHPAILRVRYTGGNYIATNTADSKQSISCTMGERHAAQRWVEKHTTDVIPSDVRPCTEEELAAIDRSKDKPAGVYYFTWDLRDEVPAFEIPAWAAEDEPRRAAEPAVLHLPTFELAMHPVLDRVMLVKDASVAMLERKESKARKKGEGLQEDWSAWVDEIRENGIIEPLRVVLVDGKYVVIEGRHRLQAAQELGFETVPAILVEIDDLLKYAEGTVRGRRHWTKSQRAYFAVLMHTEIVTEAAAREKSGKPSAFSAEGLAARYGVSPRMIEAAVSMYRSLEKYTHLRAKYEAGIWGGLGLPNLLQGLTSETHPVSKTGPGIPIERHPVANLRKIFISERAHAKNWEKADENVRATLAADLREETAKMPDDYLEWRLEILSGVIAEIRAEQKGAGA